MKAHKTSSLPPQPVVNSNVPPSEKTGTAVNPLELLESLKAKQQLFAQLQNEGLIHKDRNMEQELAKTIQDLETLIPTLGDCS
ncbi:MAG: hypothetical protein Q7T03_05745 [Deltaproteobacteria bacterium]|nr:hypothetical protein [Deltaproteobacteria bacterium]